MLFGEINKQKTQFSVVSNQVLVFLLKAFFQSFDEKKMKKKIIFLIENKF